MPIKYTFYNFVNIFFDGGIDMKQSNNYGSISKMNDKRRKPWRVRVTTGWVFDDNLMKYKQVQKYLGCYATRAEAIKALADYNDTPFDLEFKNITFAQCYDEAKKDFTNGRKRNYQAAYKYLEPIQNMPIRNIKASHMQKCIDACTTTQQQEIKTVCHKVFDYALKYEIVDKNPSSYLKSNNVATKIDRQVFTIDEIKQIKEQAAAGEWFAQISIIALYTGMRIKEIADLTPNDVDFDNNYIDIKVAKNRSSIRKVPMHSFIRPYLKDYIDHGSKLLGKTHNGFNKALKRDYNGHTAYDCRHTFITRMRECGCDPLVLQMLVGHTPQTITERVYTHISFEELSNNLELLKY